MCPVVDKSKVGCFSWYSFLRVSSPVADNAHAKSWGTWQTDVLLCKRPGGRKSFQSEGSHLSEQISPFRWDVSFFFFAHASPPLPVRGFCEFMHFLIYFYFIHFLFLFLSTTVSWIDQNVVTLVSCGPGRYRNWSRQQKLS